MSWQPFRSRLRMKTDMHCGTLMLGFVARAFPYVPQHVPIFAAVPAAVEALALPQVPTSYREMESLLLHGMRATPFFVLGEDGKPLFPWEKEARALLEADFVSSRYGVALDDPSRSAEQGRLFETEVLLAHRRGSMTATQLEGYVWLRERETARLRLDPQDGIALKDGSAPTFTAVPPQFATGPDGSDFSADQTKYSDVCAYDPDKALSYYETAKQELGVDTFEFDMVVDSDDAPQKVAQVVKEQLETTLPGMTINLVIEPKKQRVEDMQNGNFELGLTRWGPDYADPMTYLNMWITDNNNNYGKWSNAEYDAIIADCTTGQYVSDASARWQALYDAEKIIMDEAVIVPVYTKADACMIKSNVTGVDFHPVALNRVFKSATKG